MPDSYEKIVKALARKTLPGRSIGERLGKGMNWSGYGKDLVAIHKRSRRLLASKRRKRG